VGWNYAPELLSSSPRDVVRLKVADVDSTRPLVDDEVIDYYLAENGDDINLTSADVAEAIAAQFALKADRSVGRLSISYSRQADAFTAMAKRFRKRGASIGIPWAGGMGPTYLGGTNKDYYNSSNNVNTEPDIVGLEDPLEGDPPLMMGSSPVRQGETKADNLEREW
jgi:hypothetical protein